MPNELKKLRRNVCLFMQSCEAECPTFSSCLPAVRMPYDCLQCPRRRNARCLSALSLQAECQFCAESLLVECPTTVLQSPCRLSARRFSECPCRRNVRRFRVDSLQAEYPPTFLQSPCRRNARRASAVSLQAKCQTIMCRVPAGGLLENRRRSYGFQPD